MGAQACQAHPNIPGGATRGNVHKSFNPQDADGVTGGAVKNQSGRGGVDHSRRLTPLVKLRRGRSNRAHGASAMSSKGFTYPDRTFE